MNTFDLLANYTNVQISLGVLIANLLFAATCSLFLKFFYVRFGRALSNRERLAGNFVIITVTTALVITIVKSSLALSLGLVGALSIVRFRTAIKEPEELGYLFLSIALGLGFGANQGPITVAAFVTILVILWLQNRFSKSKQINGVYLHLVLPVSKKNQLEVILNDIEKFTSQVNLRKTSLENKQFTLACDVSFAKSQQAELLINALRKKYPKIELSLTDTSGLM